MNELISGPVSESENLYPILDEVLYRLNDPDREAIFLRFFDKLSFADLGARLGVSEDAARRRVDRVLDRVRSLFAQRGITPTAAALCAVLSTETIKAAPQELASAIAQTALTAVSATPTAILASIALMKSIALSTAFIVIVALTGILAGSAGWYYQDQLERKETSARAQSASIVSAEARLAQIKRQLTRGNPAQNGVRSARTIAAAAAVLLSLEDQIARDAELNRWKEQQALAQGILAYSAFLTQHGVTTAQMQQLFGTAQKTMEDLDDLREVALLAGVQIKSDLDLLSKAQQLQAKYLGAVTAIIGTETASALAAYGSSIQNQNSLKAGEANWVANQVSGVAFAQGSPLSADQRAQMTQLLIKYTPNYQPGDDNGPSTLNWDGIMTEAQQAGPAPELAALQSFRSAASVWALQTRAEQAGKATTP